MRNIKAISRVTIILASIIVIVIAGIIYYLTLPSPSPSPRLKTLVVAYAGDIHTLDPLMAIDTDSDEVIANVYDQLVDYEITITPDGKKISNTGKFVPSLATSWEISPDGLEYVFHLRQGVKFHNGDPFNATAVKYTLDRLKKYGWGVLYGTIEKVEVIDQYTVKVTLNREDPLFMHYLWLYSSSILDPIVMEEHGGADPNANTWIASHAIGTGPYKLEEWSPGERIVLTANEDYWRGKPKIDKIIINIITEVSSLEMGLITGSIDGPIESPYHIPFKDVNLLMKTPGIKAENFTSIAEVEYFGLNCKIPPFDNVLVRQAMAWATPIDDIITGAAHGWAVPAKSMLGKGMSGYDPSYWCYSYNLTKAQELLVKAGYPNGFKTEAYIPSGDELSKSMLTIWQAALLKLNIIVDIREVAAPTFWDLLWNGKVPLFAMSWPSFVCDPIYHLKFLCHSSTIGPGGNWAFYNNTKMDELLTEAYFEKNSTKRNQIIGEIQNILANDVPYIPVWHTTYTYFMKQNVTGFVFYIDTLTRYWYLDIQ
jgi:peptide/nickel transport system substrate-binding protein